MGKLKSFFHDEISSWDLTPDPYDPDAPGINTCYVITQRNESTGEIKPIQAFTFRADAEDALRLFGLGKRIGATPEDEHCMYEMTEVTHS